MNEQHQGLFVHEELIEYKVSLASPTHAYEVIEIRNSQKNVLTSISFLPRHERVQEMKYFCPSKDFCLIFIWRVNPIFIEVR